MSKRDFLKIIGGGTVLAAAPGCAVLRPTPTRALAPWLEAGSRYTEPRKRALSYAILCPNPHNRQPWQVDLSVEDEVTLYMDTDRQLPATDPYSRQLTIGLGCFVELMTLAAAADGRAVSIVPFPDGGDPTRPLDRRPVAIARFRADPRLAPDPLFANVLARRTAKEPFDTTREVPLDVIGIAREAAVHGSRVGGSVEPDSVETLRTLTTEALVVEIETPRAYRESVDLFRIGKGEIEENPDGIDFSGRLFEVMGGLGLFSRASAIDRSSSAFRQGREAVLANTRTAMAHIWTVSATNTRVDQLNAGRDWMRIHLATTPTGAALHPISQALQEYPEMATHHRRVHELLAPTGGTVQMLARLGYAEDVPPSPRWPLDKVLARRGGVAPAV